jgi:hypothetical protein
MITKFIVGTLLNLLAAVVPAALTYVKFGPAARTNAQDPKQAVFLVSVMALAFLLCLLSALVSRKSQPMGVEGVVRQLFSEGKGQAPHPEEEG